MTKAELIEALKGVPDDTQIIVSSDSEGNHYGPLSGVETNRIYKAATNWWGHVFSLDWTAKQADFSEDEWEEFKRTTPRAIVLYPVN